MERGGEVGGAGARAGGWGEGVSDGTSATGPGIPGPEVVPEVVHDAAAADEPAIFPGSAAVRAPTTSAMI